MYERILLPLDGSQFAELALPHARELARVFGSTLTVLYVIEPVILQPQPGIIGPVLNVAVNIEDEVNSARQYISSVADGLGAEGITVETVVEEGDPSSHICDYAKAHGIDLIVMSTHGRSGIRRWVYGSVADRVLRGAESPVLLVRAPEHR